MFPVTKITVVYIPTPIMAYQIVEPVVILRNLIRGRAHSSAGKTIRFDQSYLIEQSNRICGLIHRIAKNNGVRFIDTRGYIRKKSFDLGHLHGPNDAGHFNETGYGVFAEAIELGMRNGRFAACDHRPSTIARPPPG